MKLKRLLFFAGLFLVLFIIGFNIADQSSKTSTIRRTRFALGTIIEIQVRDADQKKTGRVISEAFEEFSRIENLFSTYKDTSPIWKINHDKDSLLRIDPEIYSLISRCRKITETTDGGFDICIDSVISLWGFGKETMTFPDKKKLKEALFSSGMHNLKLCGDNTIMRYNDVKLNLGAVAAGYAVDKVIELLKKNNINDALVNGGGEIRAIGNNWTVGIQHPRVPEAIIEKIKLHGYSVATSGDYEQYFEEKGVRYHHIIDPATGYPAQNCQSVTIIARDNAIADALATGVFVMGPEKGMALVESLKDVEALIVDKNGMVSRSGGFNKFLVR